MLMFFLILVAISMIADVYIGVEVDVDVFLDVVGNSNDV